MEWKIRMDLLQYAGRGVTPLSLDPVKAYKPNDESGKTLNGENPSQDSRKRHKKMTYLANACILKMSSRDCTT